MSRASWTLVVVCTAIFMLTLDVTIVSVALAGIQGELGASLSALQWVVDGYTLPLAGGLLTAAVLGDRIGRRRIFVAGLTVFVVASLACALANGTDVLVAARAVQGIGAALLFGTALPLLGAAYPVPAERARAVGLFGASYAAATAAGPLIGGVLVDGPGWRWIFLINVPIGLLALLGCLKLSESRPEQAPRNDWTGAALFSGGLLVLLLALIRGNEDGWDSPRILGLFAAGALLLGVFVWWESRVADPMLSLRLLTRPAFAGVALQSFATAATLVAATYYLALHLQNVAGYSPLETGLRVLPLTVTALVTAPLAAALLRRVGTTPLLVLGLVLAGAGLLGMTLIDPAGSLTVLAPGFVLAGAGLGIGAAATAAAGLSAVEPAEAGMATGTVNTMRQIGTSAGVAALGALVQSQAEGNARPLIGELGQVVPEKQLISEIGAGLGRHAGAYLPAGLRETVSSIGITATDDAVSTAFLAAGVTALVAAVVCALLLIKWISPVVLVQALWRRYRMVMLPPAEGSASGVALPEQPSDAEPLRIAVVGDSIAAGYGVTTHDEGFGGLLARDLSDRTGRAVEWTALGKYGATARRIRYRLLPELGDRLDLVLVVGGANDVLSGRPVQEWAEHLGVIVDELSERAGQVLVAGIPHFDKLPGMPRRLGRHFAVRATALDRASQEVCAARPAATWVDAEALLPFRPEYFAADDFHPSAVGYRRWAAAVAVRMRLPQPAVTRS